MILQNLIRLHKITQYLFYNLLIVYIKNLERKAVFYGNQFEQGGRKQEVAPGI